MWPRWGRGRTCCSPMFAVPAIARQSLISEPPSRRRLVGSSYRRSTTRAATWPQQAPPSPFAAGGRTTSRHGATPARALACPSACATGARTESAIPKPVLRAGGRVVATAPAPSSARGSSAITIAGCTSHFHRCSRLPLGQSGAIRQSAHSPGSRIAWTVSRYRRAAGTGGQPTQLLWREPA